MRPPYRSGSPFKTASDRSEVVWPENRIVPETLRDSDGTPARQDHPDLSDALAHLEGASDATITMDSPCAAFQKHPDLANPSTNPQWQGEVTELLWVHGKCVPDESEFLGSPLHQALQSIWPNHLLLADVFL